MNKTKNIIFVILFIMLIAIPHLQGKLFTLPVYSLIGYEKKIALPKFDFNSFYNGNFQSQFAKYASQNIGLRSYFVKTDNQISVSLFNQTSPRTRSGVIIGKNKFLFGAGYIKALKNKYKFNPTRLEELSSKLLELQNKLRLKNKAFLLLISPSKAELYKDEIPASFKTSPKVLPDKLNVFRDLLNQKKINYVDAPKLFSELNPSLTLFSTSGTHWSYYPVCLVIKKISQEVEKQLPIKMLDLNCGTPDIVRGPIGTDKDLLDFLNIWNEKSFSTNNQYSITSINETSDAVRPKLLIVGTSFVWQLLKHIDRYHFFSKRDFFYYFDVNHSNRGIVPRGKIDKKNIDIANIVNQKDVVILEINEIKLEELGYGFIDEAINKL